MKSHKKKLKALKRLRRTVAEIEREMLEDRYLQSARTKIFLAELWEKNQSDYISLKMES